MSLIRKLGLGRAVLSVVVAGLGAIAAVLDAGGRFFADPPHRSLGGATAPAFARLADEPGAPAPTIT
jgi:hypothetical protein